ncbi:MAG: hypothetical protein KDJ15_08230, partial [Alphaproteobacteria bacterium]|nr:hypothetical protein [Alphaproteobacteria bacterium]
MTNGVPNRKAVQQAIESRRFPGLSDVQYREQIATYLSAWSGQTVRPGEASYDAGVDDFIQKFDQNPQNLHLAAPTHDNLAMFLDYVRMALFEKTAAQSSNPALFQPEIMATRARYALDAPRTPAPVPTPVVAVAPPAPPQPFLSDPIPAYAIENPPADMVAGEYMKTTLPAVIEMNGRGSPESQMLLNDLAEYNAASPEERKDPRFAQLNDIRNAVELYEAMPVTEDEIQAVQTEQRAEFERLGISVSPSPDHVIRHSIATQKLNALANGTKTAAELGLNANTTAKISADPTMLAPLRMTDEKVVALAERWGTS